MVVENGFSGTRNVQETDEGQKFSNWVKKKLKIGQGETEREGGAGVDGNFLIRKVL